MLNRFRWRLSALLERISRRIEWWSEYVAPETDGLNITDVMNAIEPTDTPFLRSLDR